MRTTVHTSHKTLFNPISTLKECVQKKCYSFILDILNCFLLPLSKKPKSEKKIWFGSVSNVCCVLIDYVLYFLRSKTFRRRNCIKVLGPSCGTSYMLYNFAYYFFIIMNSERFPIRILLSETRVELRCEIVRKCAIIAIRKSIKHECGIA